MPMKMCSRCKQEKQLYEFAVSNANNDGLQYKCRSCRHEIYLLNKEKCNAQSKEYYRRNKARIQVKQREWSAKNRDRHNELHRNWYELNPEERMLQGAKKRARKEGVLFDLKREDIVIPERCPLLNVPLQRGRGRVCRYSPSLDRIIPGGDYTKDNVWVISYRANTIKNNAYPSEILSIAQALCSKFPHLINANTKIQNKPSQEEI